MVEKRQSPLIVAAGPLALTFWLRNTIFMRIRSFNIQWPTWSDLRTVGNSGPVRAAIIVPVIGYLIVLNSSVADYLKMHGIE
jgi:hypothetical protein